MSPAARTPAPGTLQEPHDRGFTLIELLIALAMVAAMTAALVGAVGGDARTRLAVQQRREGLMVAQSVLDQTADPTAPLQGQWGSYAWRVQRQPYQLSDPLDRHPLEQITVAVGDAGTRRGEIVRLSTVRMKP